MRALLRKKNSKRRRSTRGRFPERRRSNHKEGSRTIRIEGRRRRRQDAGSERHQTRPSYTVSISSCSKNGDRLKDRPKLLFREDDDGTNDLEAESQLTSKKVVDEF